MPWTRAFLPCLGLIGQGTMFVEADLMIVFVLICRDSGAAQADGDGACADGRQHGNRGGALRHEGAAGC